MWDLGWDLENGEQRVEFWGYGWIDAAAAEPNPRDLLLCAPETIYSERDDPLCGKEICGFLNF